MRNELYLREYYRHADNMVFATVDNRPSPYDEGHWPDVITLIWRRVGNLDEFLSGGRFPHLEVIEAHNVQLDDLQFLRHCPLLRKLDVGGNQIATLNGVENCPDLMVLGCSDNRLTSLEGIESLPNLVSLYANRNHLIDIESVRGRQLDDLDISDQFVGPAHL